MSDLDEAEAESPISDGESDTEFAEDPYNLGWGGEVEVEEQENEDVEVEEETEHVEDSDEQFDISLPATHSYLSTGLVSMPGRSVLESGWCGRVPCVGHHSVLYPGETIPMVMSHPRDCDLLNAAIRTDKLFGLLFAESPDAGNFASGYGVLCEVFEATAPESNFMLAVPSLVFKAKARQRFRCRPLPRKQPFSVVDLTRVKLMDIVILPELEMSNPLANTRLMSLDKFRSSTSNKKLAKVKQMDVMVTNWPEFIFDGLCYNRLTKIIHSYFSNLKYECLPTDMMSLSFWAASNLPLSYKDRLSLFKEDNALQRLRMEARFVQEYYVLCCQGCGEPMRTEIAKREHIFAMSTEGMKSNFCNLGGYVHDIMTVSEIANVRTAGPPSAEFSWFPGYLWTILVCSYCGAHIGWRFTATKRSFQRQTFYAVCKNYVFPYSPTDNIEI